MKTLEELMEMRDRLQSSMQIRRQTVDKLSVSAVDMDQDKIQKAILVCGGTACKASNSTRL